jgi:hypothetical protein
MKRYNLVALEFLCRGMDVLLSGQFKLTLPLSCTELPAPSFVSYTQLGTNLSDYRGNKLRLDFLFTRLFEHFLLQSMHCKLSGIS